MVLQKYNGVDCFMDCEKIYCYYWSKDGCEFQKFSEKYLDCRYECYDDFEKQIINNQKNINY